MTDPYRILDPAGDDGRSAGHPYRRPPVPATGSGPATVNGHPADGVNRNVQGATDSTYRRGVLRPVLWLLLVITVAANAVISSANLNVALGVASGLAALGCATALVVDHYRHRRG